MRLSPEAKALLDAHRIIELQALPLERLLHPAVYDEYLMHCRNPLPAISIGYTVYPSLIDAISLDSLKAAVVVSNGFIHSQETIEGLAAQSSFKCPLTRQALVRDSFGPAGAKKSFVNLAKVDEAINHFRRLRDAARAAGAAAAPGLAASATGAAAAAAGAGGAGSPAAVGAGATITSLFSRLGLVGGAAATPAPAASDAVDAAIAALSARTEHLNLSFKVSGSKLRVLLHPVTSGASRLDLLESLLKALFAHSPESKITSGTSYYLENFGRCWQLSETEARLEFWFPIDARRLNDEEVNRLNTALLNPLHLAAAPPPAGIAYGSIRTLGAREYKDAFPAMRINIHQAAACLKSFMQGVDGVARDRGIALNDRAISSMGAAPPPAIHSGLMFFGAAAASAPAASAHAAYSTPATFYTHTHY